MIRFFNPKTIAKPASRYSHGALAEAGVRWLHISGQVGVDPDGKIVKGIEAQMERAFQNVFAVVREGGMSIDEIVKLSCYVLTRDHVPLFRTTRDQHFVKTAPASTLLIVAALALPDWLVEIEAVAASGR
jgi:enamine deaminase RidA (YjgF/YER057c/UK114 family)